MQEQIEKIKQGALTEIGRCQSEKELEKILYKYLGRKDGQLTAILRGVSELPEEQRQTIGSLANKARAEIDQALQKKKAGMANAGAAQTGYFDVTVPGAKPTTGHMHPLTRIRLEVQDIFKSMGFKVYEGNELTDLYYNFLSLNFPDNHPAMDSYDTFFIKEDPKKKIKPEERRMMRAHTSNMQVRIMEQNKPPLKVIVPGRCFRNEATDASHDHTFHQVEGFVVDENISIANLVYTQKALLSKIFGQEVKVRLRPGYFPFVEPGFELDCSCIICGGKGCSVCKRTGWVELIPCGMIHPKVLESAGYPKGKYTGFAFGMGWSRLAMMKYEIDDVRLLLNGDMRFLEQF
ncbi:MAG: phenylalanine--tRNA ligase subunit alpha [Parcubacteria group bacterium]|nr:phenylalanine--tRNA ligase subunit alpha [Parcubacteria group bacterium]